MFGGGSLAEVIFALSPSFGPRSRESELIHYVQVMYYILPPEMIIYFRLKVTTMAAKGLQAAVFELPFWSP